MSHHDESRDIQLNLAITTANEPLRSTMFVPLPSKHDIHEAVHDAYLAEASFAYPNAYRVCATAIAKLFGVPLAAVTEEI